MTLQSRHNDVVKQRLSEGPHNASWLCHEIQNELLSAMAQWVLLKITAEVKEAGYLADEAISVSMSSFLFAYAMAVFMSAFFWGLCIQKNLMQQLLLSIFLVSLTSASVIVSVRYDGASVISGCYIVVCVSTRILEMNPKAIYILLCST